LISWIVASHDPEILGDVLAPSLDPAQALGDEIIVVRNAASIAAAYLAGQQRARHPVRAFIHHDVRILACSRCGTSSWRTAPRPPGSSAWSDPRRPACLVGGLPRRLRP
jgi:hypothetical protein